MATNALPLPYSTFSFSRTLQLYAREIGFELLRALRNKTFALSTIGFPALFYLLFGVVNRHATMGSGANVAKYLLGSYAVFGAVGAALFGIGVGLAMERSSGWLELKRASPMPPFAYLVARCTMAMTFSLVIVTVLTGIGIGLAGVHVSFAEYSRMLLIALAGSVPFAAMGLLLAMLLPPNAAPGVVNMIYLPMSYCSGLWIPVMLLPHWLQKVAPWLPTYHFAELMLHAFGYAPASDSIAHHILALLGFTLIFLGCASLAFQRTEANA